MKHRVAGACVALALVASLAAPGAEARDRLSPGAAAAIGILGGLAVGGAIAASQPPVYDEPVPAYEPEPVYVAPRPPRRRVYVEHCYTERSTEYVPGWGWQPVRRRVCD